MKGSLKFCSKLPSWPTKLQYLATLTGSLNVISTGMHYGWTSPSLPILLSPNSTIPISPEQGSTVASIILLGTLSGCIISGCILDKIGRKKTILLSTIPAFTSWTILAYSSTLTELLVERYIGGICDGMIFCALNVYVSEIAGSNNRGLLGSSIGIAYSLGHLLINVIGPLFSIRHTALICSAVPIALLLSFCWMPESPYYLLTKRKFNEAKQNLRLLNGVYDCEEDVKRIMDGIDAINSNKSSVCDLIKVPKDRKIMIVIMVLRGVQQASGDTAILFYAQSIFSNVEGILSAESCTIIYMGMQLIVATLSSLWVDKIGRRPLLIISMAGCGVAHFISATYFVLKNRTDVDVSQFDLIPIVGLVGYVLMFGIGLQTIPISIPGELLPTNVKGYGISFSDIYFVIVASGITKYFQATKDSLGIEVPFITFAISCTIGLIFVVFCMVETKNKTLEAIQTELREK